MITGQQRSFNMSRIRDKDTKIELLLRKNLWALGYRYRKNYRVLTGVPDIVFLKKKVAIFCDSEFWHGYDWEIQRNNLKSNYDFWNAKISANIERDKVVNEILKKEGWTVLRFWGNDIKGNISQCIAIIEKHIK